MIITRLTGGLGNQMFQYAIARGYQRNENEQIYLDDSLLTPVENDINKIIHRPYSLAIFSNIKAKKLPKHLLRRLYGISILDRIKRKIFNFQSVSFDQLHMSPFYLTKTNKQNVILKGFFQSESYFKHIREKLLQDFKFPDLDIKNLKLKKEIENISNAVSIHIRRGDYLSILNKNVFNSVNLKYYEEALLQLKNKTGIASFAIFVFTDDVTWVKENLFLGSHQIIFVEGNIGNNSWKDMYLMSVCKHHIIANSSFSWWGAWLSVNRGYTLAPQHWYIPDTESFEIEHIIPEHWYTINYQL